MKENRRPTKHSYKKSLIMHCLVILACVYLVYDQIRVYLLGHKLHQLFLAIFFTLFVIFEVIVTVSEYKRSKLLPFDEEIKEEDKIESE